MNDIRFKNRDELKQYISAHMVKKLGSGEEGECVLLDNGEVIKYLYKDYFPKNALQFKDLDIPSFVFAKSGAYISFFVSAVFMRYAKGDALLDRIPLEQRLDVLADHLSVLVKNIKEASDNGIYVVDFHRGNVLYDMNKFEIVDTIPYLKGDVNKWIETENFYEIMNAVYDALLPEVLKYKKEIGSEYSFFRNLEYLKNPKEYLQLLKSRIEDIVEKEVTTLGDVSMSLRKKFNR